MTTTTTAPQVRARLTDGVTGDLGRLLPEGICRTFRVMPYAVADGVVLVAAADVDDPITRQVVEERIDRQVQLVRHTGNEITEAIDEVYPPPRARSRPRTSAGPGCSWRGCSPAAAWSPTSSSRPR